MTPGVDDGDALVAVDHLVRESEPLAAFIDQVRYARNRMRMENVKERVTIEFDASGYPMHGDFDVRIKISAGYNVIAEGTDFLSVLDEALRRLRFNNNNKPLLMPPA